MLLYVGLCRASALIKGGLLLSFIKSILTVFTFFFMKYLIEIQNIFMYTQRK